MALNAESKAQPILKSYFTAKTQRPQRALQSDAPFRVTKSCILHHLRRDIEILNDYIRHPNSIY